MTRLRSTAQGQLFDARGMSCSVLSPNARHGTLGGCTPYARIERALETALRNHLAWSLERVFARHEGYPLSMDQTTLRPSLWVAGLATNPTITRTVIEPTVAIEVVGGFPSDWKSDVNGYLTVDSLQELLLVNSRARRIDVFRRSKGIAWQTKSYGRGSIVPIETVGLNLDMAHLWRSAKCSCRADRGAHDQLSAFSAGDSGTRCVQDCAAREPSLGMPGAKAW